MKILLINSNPVVSRLTALSARKEEIQIDEVQEVSELNSGHYDIVFVDSDSWSKEVDSAISKNIQTEKRVLFYAQDDKDSKEFFDITILKPFLPSEVSAVIRLVEESEPVEIDTKKSEIQEAIERPKDKKEDNFLESLEDKLDFEDKVESSITQDKPIELKSRESNRDDDIFAELKEDGKTFDEQLKEAFPAKSKESEVHEELFDINLDDIKELELTSKSSNKEIKSDITEVKIEESELFEIDLDESREVTLKGNLNSNDSKVTDSPKDQKLKEFNESVLEPIIQHKKSESKVETRVLDESELSTIKGILENDEDLPLELEEFMNSQPATSNLLDGSKKDKKQKQKREKIDSDLNSKELEGTLVSMPVEALKVLLAGANVKISIKFPKAK